MAGLIDLNGLTTFYTQVLNDLSAYATYGYLNSLTPTLDIMVSLGPGGYFEVHNPLSNSVAVTVYVKYDGNSSVGSVSNTNYDNSYSVSTGGIVTIRANSGSGYYSFKFYSEDGAVSEVVSELY